MTAAQHSHRRYRLIRRGCVLLTAVVLTPLMSMTWSRSLDGVTNPRNLFQSSTGLNHPNLSLHIRTSLLRQDAAGMYGCGETSLDDLDQLNFGISSEDSLPRPNFVTTSSTSME